MEKSGALSAEGGNESVFLTLPFSRGFFPCSPPPDVMFFNCLHFLKSQKLQ